MAVFVALFFQVIFVFFAMAINVGLVVHDKINLQNAVDFAAYYGAMKQAQVLNQMAHINYQMRQNYKLFVWRYRVLGTLGNSYHPLNHVNYYDRNQTSMQADGPSWTPGGPAQPTDILPSVCIAHSYFQETIDLDPQAASVCRDNNFSLPTISGYPSPPSITPGAGGIDPGINFLGQQLQRFCWEASIFNWYYAARILAHFRTDGLMRKRMIYRLAENLSRPDPLDIKNESIQEGARKTFLRNLTTTNEASMNAGTGQFQYLNSMGNGQCADPYFWLPEIKIRPVIYYHDWDSQANSFVGAPNNICDQAIPVANREVASPGKNPARGYLSLPSAFNQPIFNGRWSEPVTQYLLTYWVGEPGGAGNTLDTHSSVGFEKNPWCMVYSGAIAQTTVRKPFDPTGQGVLLQARGFAKPFGGRMGPWYGTRWPSGSTTSQATNRSPSEMVDHLLPTRAGSGVADSDADVANHSRYPGDQYGMGSRQALSSMITSFMNHMNHPNRQSQPSPLALAAYDHIGSTVNLAQHKDPLARVASTRRRQNVSPKQRTFELAAVAPDPFDAIYYSIEPRYHDNYFTGNTTNNGAPFPNIDEQLWDVGSSADGSGFNNEGPQPTQAFNLMDQVNVASGQNVSHTPAQTYEADYPHVVRNWEHLLTSWNQTRVTDYALDPNRFGICQDPIVDHNTTLPTTGSCLVGGRTGYSVKLISRDYLESNQHAIGGSNGAQGGILNPPTSLGF